MRSSVRAAALGAEAALVAAGGFFLWSIVAALTAPPTMDSLPVALPEEPQLRRPSAAAASYRTIVERDIFNPPRPVAAVALAKDPLPILDAKLLGTAHKSSGEAFAIIADGKAGGAHALYRVGDTIQGRRVSLIERDRLVLVASDGLEEALDVPLPSRLFADSFEPIARRASLRLDEGAGTGLRGLPRAAASDLRISDDAVRPEMAAGRLSGFRIVRVAPGSLLEDLQARVGDLIVRVNGRRPVDPLAGRVALASLERDAGPRLEVDRSGAVVTLGLREPRRAASARSNRPSSASAKGV